MIPHPPHDSSDSPNNPEPTPPRDAGDFLPDHLLPRFVLGQRVVHREEGYRGVIVDFDMASQADEEWARDVPHLPTADQPWYHVLIHDSKINTYVAQEQLQPDPSDVPIDHPLIAEFFDDYRGGAIRAQRCVVADVVKAHRILRLIT